MWRDLLKVQSLCSNTLLRQIITLLDIAVALQVIDRVVFKAVMHKTVTKVMHSHRGSTDARFLIKEGPKIHKLLMHYVEKMASVNSAE